MECGKLSSDNDDCEWDMMRENDELLRNTCDKSMIVKKSYLAP